MLIIHLLLLLTCILSIEIFILCDLPTSLRSFIKLTKKILHIISHSHVSDHWKEKIIPSYSLKMMKLTLRIILILILMFSFFALADYVYNGFLKSLLSSLMIIETMVISFGYIYLRKFLIK